MEMFTLNDWTYVCAETDQGFFFYMFRVRYALGLDLQVDMPHCHRAPWRPASTQQPPTIPSRGRRHARGRSRRLPGGARGGVGSASRDGAGGAGLIERPWWVRPGVASAAWLHHYAGGKKPETMLLESNACDKVRHGKPYPAIGLRPMLIWLDPVRGLSPELHSWELTRAFSWGSRLQVDLRALDRRLAAGQPGERQGEEQSERQGRRPDATPGGRSLTALGSLIRKRYHRAREAAEAAARVPTYALADSPLSDIGLGECSDFLDRGIRCIESSLRTWNVTISTSFIKYLSYRRRPLPPGTTSISAERFIRTQWAHVSDSMPSGPSIFGS